ncbi:chemotaxis protein CheX [Domibacillus epiphyticus]|uniref:Chemotaxis protein CheX n=1 Tax=Domibacillus epiphyticus TaxID=1714355 RepID=A0A1V2A422_9BACI|nr:chemotaxis protein CheX [Domibacillus epiphyticus]OMP65660.1 chemotaxis protein CheX [Domibacillus epiphyticus]
MENTQQDKNTVIKEILNCTIESIRTVIPVEAQVGRPSLLTGSFHHHAIGVFIGITGDLPGRVILDGPADAFSNLGTKMFGMPIEGEMVESFAGEVVNMIAGNMGSNLFAKGITIDITPPTIIVGDSKISGFKEAIEMPIIFQDTGEFRLVLNIE